MAEISHLDELLSPTINISKQSKHKRKRASRNNEGRDDEANPFGSGSYSSQIRKRRDARLHELDLYSQLSFARMRRRRNIITGDLLPVRVLDGADLRGNAFFAPELKSQGNAVVKLRANSEKMPDELTATANKPYNESRLICKQATELRQHCGGNFTMTECPEQSHERIIGSSHSRFKQVRKKSENQETRLYPNGTHKPEAFDLYGMVGRNTGTPLSNTRLEEFARNFAGSAANSKRTSITDKLSTTKGGSVIRIKSMSEKRHSPFQETSYDSRISNYKDFILLVLHCNAVYFDWVFPTVLDNRERRVDVFVGQGNNSTLVRKVLMKRWWLKPTETITSSTQFAWTQIKHKGYVLSQRTRSFYQSNEKFEQNISAEGSSSPLAKVMHPKELAQQKQLALAIPYKEVTKRKEPARLLNYVQRVHNHLEFSGFIGNKKSLLSCMTAYYRYHKTPIDNYSIPLTFYVSEAANEKEFAVFREVFLEREKQLYQSDNSRRNNTWIIKPGENSNRGHGIVLSSSLSDISGKVREGRHSHVIQQYISDPLLYQRRKFDIRAYCLVTQVNGVMRAYWYQEGYIRTSAQLFRTDCLGEPMIHLTNDAVQKHGPNYGKYEPANKVSFDDFQKYLLSNGCPEERSLGYIIAQMKRIVTEVIRSSYCLLDPNCRENNFELFGVDFLVDSSMRLWLLEFNTNPCLQLCSSVLNRLLPKMLDNVMTLAVDPLLPMPPNKNRQYFPDVNLQNNRFELVFDSTFDRDEQYEQYLLRHLKHTAHEPLTQEDC